MKKILLFLFLFFPMIFYAQESKIKELDINLENYNYPFETHFIELEQQKQKLKMAYMDVNPEGRKSILLLHGKNFNASYWEETIKALTQQGFRVIAPDQIGFGKSTKPENYQYTFQQLALNTKAVLEELNIDEITVLGHSMGGMLATRFALMFPEITEKLILENPIGLEDWKTMVPYKNVDWWYQQELNADYDQLKKYQEESYYDGKWKSKYDPMVNVLAGWTLNEDYPIIAWNNALTYDMIFTQPVVYEFKDVEAPTLLIIGTRDRTALGKPLVSKEKQKEMGRYDRLGKRTEREIPNAKLVEIQDIGHLPHIEDFDSFIKPLKRFLKD